jgi:hypothetical protein
MIDNGLLVQMLLGALLGLSVYLGLLCRGWHPGGLALHQLASPGSHG